MRLLVSACLLGVRCRYDGATKPLPAETLQRLRARHALVPVCPEQLGGLPTPRAPSERRGDRVVANTGRDVTAEYARGAAEALRLARLLGCEAALLKARSPSCGRGEIYDGSFTGARVPGDGVTAALLAENGLPVYTEDEVSALLADE